VYANRSGTVPERRPVGFIRVQDYRDPARKSRAVSHWECTWQHDPCAELEAVETAPIVFA
jgi:hypothetical protein